jgi:hypothetical protein
VSFSVVSLVHSEIKIGDEIELHLMRRERNSLFAVPVDKYFADINNKHPSMSNQLNSYSNLILASPVEVAEKIISRERMELEMQLR